MKNLNKIDLIKVCAVEFVIIFIICGCIGYWQYSKISALGQQLEDMNNICIELETKVAEQEVVIEESEAEIANQSNMAEFLTEKLNAREDTIAKQEEVISELYEDANKEKIRRDHHIVEAEYTKSDGTNMLFSFYVPNGIDMDSPKPLIVYLHGSGECGNNLNVLKNCKNGFSGFVYDGLICPDCYILMPQNPGGLWKMHVDDIINLIDYLSKTYNIDKECISVTGHSLGGWGTIDFVLEKPNYFFKCAPMSATIDINKCSDIKIPILFLVGSMDSSESFIQANDKMQSEGLNSDIIVYQNEGHIIPYHYLDDNCAIVEWLITK